LPVGQYGPRPLACASVAKRFSIAAVRSTMSVNVPFRRPAGVVSDSISVASPSISQSGDHAFGNPRRRLRPKTFRIAPLKPRA
jgi:hypothetical protein